MNEDDLRAITIGELQPLAGNIELADDDPAWPAMFAREAARIRAAPIGCCSSSIATA